jgi:peptidoglycan/LPS O-acetylase OafA/YrhL
MQQPSQTTTGTVAAPADRIIELDGLRGCACLLVVIGHYFGEVAHGARFLRLEWIGVDLFFCLSGFLIGGILLDNRASHSYGATFYIRRGFRIFPIYYLTIASVLLVLPRFAGLVEPAFPPSVYFGYAQNIVMSLTGVETTPWLMPTWTLCVEEQFYLLLPLIVYFAPPRRLALILLVLTASASLFRLGLVLMSANKLALFMLLPSEWDLLFLGVLGAYARRSPALWSQLLGNDRRTLKAITLTGLALVPLLAIADNVLGLRTFDVVGRLALGLALTGLVLLLVDGAPEGLRFRSQVLRFFGVISYGLYLVHQPVAGILHGVILGSRPDIGTLPQFAVTLGALGASVGIAYLSWTFFESPLVRLGHRWRYRTGRGGTTYSSGSVSSA